MFQAQIKVLDYIKSDFLNSVLYFAYIAQIALFGLMLIIRPAYVYRDEKIEEYIAANRKEIHKSKCEACNLTKILRSFHCDYCKRCIAKWQEHSFWFNKCIDARNIAIYWLFLFVCTVINLISIISCLYYNKTRTVEMPRIPFYILVLICQAVSLLKTFLQYTILISTNITILEGENWFRVPYMWKDDTRQFFNPFDNGILRNIISTLKSLFTLKTKETGYEILPNSELETSIFKINYKIPK